MGQWSKIPFSANTTLAPFVIPANRVTIWQPGVTYNGGIPVRNTIFTTLSPLSPAAGTTVTISIATPAVVSLTAHGLAAGQRFTFQTTGALPTGISLNTNYYVAAAGLAANTFQFCPDNGSGASSGVSVNTSITQSGTQSIGLDDTAQIQTAINNAAAIATNEANSQVVKLNTGVFRICVGGLRMRTSFVTLRGSGPGAGTANFGINGVNNGVSAPLAGNYAVDATATQLVKADRADNFGGLFGLIGFGGDQSQFQAPINLTADAVKDAFSCTLASAPSVSPGDLALIDVNTFGTCATLTGSIPASSNVLTVTAATGTIAAGAFLWAPSASLIGGTTILPYGTGGTTGAGGTGTYQLSTTSTGAISSRAMATELPNSDTAWGPNNMNNTNGPTSRSFFCRQDRSLSQVMEVLSVVGNTVTFKTPFHITYPAALSAQFTAWDLANSGFAKYTGIEDLFIWGGTDGQGNIGIGLASYCWIKNVESCWTVGSSIRFTSSYRCEVRDSFLHESPDVNPGGGGYLFSIDNGAADNLLENNIHWFGNKQMVMRASGGGNVIAYCYLDDSFGTTYPSLGEAGMNAGHMASGHMELFEGNYSQNYNCDTYWGNEIYITVFRCWLSGLRAAAGPLAAYTATVGSTVFPYKDFGDRDPVNIQGLSKFNNVVGCVLGFSGQPLLNDPGSGETQTSFQYEQITALQGNEVNMWCFGKSQGSVDPVNSNSVIQFMPNTQAGQLRQGNYDYKTNSQIWYANIGDTGSVSTGAPMSLPNSLYLSSKPAFFGSNVWPPVDPSTGTVHKTPAHRRFETISGLTIPPGNQ